MVCSGAPLALSPRAHDIPAAVFVGAEKGTSPLHFFQYAGLGRIEAVSRTGRIIGDRYVCELPVVIEPVPIGAPFPHITCHIVQSVAVGRILFNRSGACKTIPGFILSGELPLKSIGHGPSTRHELVAPGVHVAREAAPGGKLPFGFRGKALARPTGIGRGIFPGHVHHGFVFSAIDAAARTKGMPPAGSRDKAPPLKVVAQADLSGRRCKHHRAGYQHVGRRIGKLFGGRHLFCNGYVACCSDKLRKLRIGHFVFINIKGIDPHPVYGPAVVHRQLTAIAYTHRVGGSHAEFPAGDEHHAGRQCTGHDRGVRNGLPEIHGPAQHIAQTVCGGHAVRAQGYMISDAI